MIGVMGAGAFGAALASAFARDGREVLLWARRGAQEIAANREAPKLPGVALPQTVDVTGDASALRRCEIVLLAVPAQALAATLAAHGHELAGKTLVACCKGLDLSSGLGPTGMIAAAVPTAKAAILSGPSFAAEIGRGLPTALTIAAEDGAEAEQHALSTPRLRLYRTVDVTGVEVGGALKNVIAIACGGCIGEGMGESARAAVMTRGFAEMQRLAQRLGAQPETLMGLSGLGDLALTCGSDLSRNFRFGLALGRRDRFDANVTVEGVATARAAVTLASRLQIDLPICAEVARISDGSASVAEAIQSLLSRPLRAE